MTMMVNSFNSDLFSMIMVLFFNIHTFTRPNKMGLWNTNIVTFYKWLALKFYAYVHTQFQGECTLTAVHIINQLPTLVFSFKNPSSLCVWMFGLCYQCSYFTQIQLSYHNFYFHKISCWLKSL
jgi:hypothetical protein